MTDTAPYVIGVTHIKENLYATRHVLDVLKKRGVQTIAIERCMNAKVVGEIMEWIKERYPLASRYHGCRAYETILAVLSNDLRKFESDSMFFESVEQHAKKIGMETSPAESEVVFKTAYKIAIKRMIETNPNKEITEKEFEKNVESYPAGYVSHTIRDRDMEKRQNRKKKDAMLIGSIHAAHLIDELHVPDEKSFFVANQRVYSSKKGRPTSWRLRFRLWEAKRIRVRNERRRMKERAQKRAA